MPCRKQKCIDKIWSEFGKNLDENTLTRLKKNGLSVVVDNQREGGRKKEPSTMRSRGHEVILAAFKGILLVDNTHHWTSITDHG